ncbi:MAG: hypothetical protein AABZ55_00105, partial [Bdellovibrionota bacterium]
MNKRSPYGLSAVVIFSVILAVPALVWATDWNSYMESVIAAEKANLAAKVKDSEDAWNYAARVQEQAQREEDAEVAQQNDLRTRQKELAKQAADLKKESKKINDTWTRVQFHPDKELVEKRESFQKKNWFMRIFSDDPDASIHDQLRRATNMSDEAGSL